MKVVSCLNLKGGSGKTTVAVNLAAVLSDRQTVRVLDLDPQRSATKWAAQSMEPEANGGICLRRDVRHVSGSGPAAIKAELAKAERELVGILVLDTPPELEARALVAALVSDLVLIPVCPSPLDLWAAEAAVSTAREARAERGGLPAIALVPSRTMASTVVSRELPASLHNLGEEVAPGIGQRVALVEAAMVGETIATYAPGSPGHCEFMELGKYVIRSLRNGS